jgi:drug/metabolite transporter (DMT)-like permease
MRHRVAAVDATIGRTWHLPLIAATIAVIAFGFGPLFVRGIDASSAMIVFWRVLLALPVSIGVAYATGGRLSWHLLRQAVPIGICFAISIIASFTSFRETSIANATLIPALQPALVLIFAARMFGERRTRTDIICVIASFLGVSAVVLASSAGGNSWCGDLLAVVNLLVFTIYFLLAKHVRSGNVHSWSLLATIFVITAVVVTPWAIAVDGGVTALPGAHDWLLVMAIVLFPGMVGHGFITWAHHYVDVSVTSTLTLASPVVAIVGAWIVYSESLSAVQVLGAVAVLVALGVLVHGQRGARAQAAEAALGGDLLDGVEGLDAT